MSVGPGWIGQRSLLLNVLAVFGADQDEDGNFFVSGGIYGFMGLTGPAADIVVDSEARYRKDGDWYSIVGAIKATSYVNGIVTVIA